jgi:hypothetical protein
MKYCHDSTSPIGHRWLYHPQVPLLCGTHDRPIRNVKVSSVYIHRDFTHISIKILRQRIDGDSIAVVMSAIFVVRVTLFTCMPCEIMQA